MKVVLSLVLLAAGALIWVFGTRGEPTFLAPEAAGPSFAPAPTVLLRHPGAGQVELAFDVAGMCCTGCTGKLHARLLALPGVHEAAVDFDDACARVIADAGVGAESLRSALTFEKYSASVRGAP